MLGLQLYATLHSLQLFINSSCLVFSSVIEYLPFIVQSLVNPRTRENDCMPDIWKIGMCHQRWLLLYSFESTLYFWISRNVKLQLSKAKIIFIVRLIKVTRNDCIKSTDKPDLGAHTYIIPSTYENEAGGV